MVEFIMRYWIEVVFTSILALFAFGYRKLEKKIQEQEAIRLGVQAMLRNMIVQVYNKCTKEKHCKIYELESTESMYAQYKELGGNGAVSNFMEKLRELPSVDPCECSKRCEEGKCGNTKIT